MMAVILLRYDVIDEEENVLEDVNEVGDIVNNYEVIYDQKPKLIETSRLKTSIKLLVRKRCSQQKRRNRIISAFSLRI